MSHTLGVTSITYGNGKYCTFTVIFTRPYTLLTTAAQRLFAHPV